MNVSDVFNEIYQGTQIQTYSDFSDCFQTYTCPIQNLKNLNFFRCSSFPLLNYSDSDFFRFFQIFSDSFGFFRIFQIFRLSPIFQILFRFDSDSEQMRKLMRHVQKRTAHGYLRIYIYILTNM